MWEFSEKRPLDYSPLWLRNQAELLDSILLPRLAKYRMETLSDHYCQFFAAEDFIVTVRRERHYEGWVAKGATPEVFAGVQLRKA